jgi:hypothetical protein
MNNSTPPTLFPSFNARNMTPSEVAATFVHNEEFDMLWTNEHAVLLGPRGSGKTTLLKMLTLQALSNWNHPHAKEVRNRIPFNAIYIPTDVHWQRQLSFTDEQLGRLPDLQRTISRAAITTNVFSAVCSAMADLLELEVGRDEKREIALAKTLIREWKLAPTVPCLDLVSQSLDSRMGEIRAAINEAVTTSKAPTKLPRWFFLDYLASAAAACAAFRRLFKPKRNSWALCFDELELAPEWFQKQLFQQLRSTDQRFRFKLSTSPIPPSLGDTAAKPLGDFKLIPLWHHSRKNICPFSESLTRSLIKQKLTTRKTPLQLFAESPLAAGSGYAKGSPTWRLFRKALKTDRKMALIFKENGISLTNPTSSKPNIRDKLLRKAKPIVLFREEFRKLDKQGQVTLRSRKVASFCYGIDAIYDVSDGNPRWLTWIITELLLHAKRTRHLKVNPKAQADILLKASQQFCSFLQTLPHPMASDGLTMFLLLERIRNYFFNRYIFDEFSLDPVGSFTVDEQFHPHTIALLRLALDHGALVYVDPRDNAFDANLKGKHFRLSYLLAPNWNLPLRCYRSVALSSILGTQVSPLQQELPLQGL